MRKTSLLALAALAAFSSSASAGAVAAARAVESVEMGQSFFNGEPGSAKNGGRRIGHSNRAQKRASVKKRNQARHRKACKG